MVSNEHRALLAALPDGWSPDALSAIPDFNDDDTTTHADIMALFDRAIAAQVEA
ncbi:hypothetical protein [Devosia sp. DBB001]|nr:hypothetical protein [Devosia sp. DBB001]